MKLRVLSALAWALAVLGCSAITGNDVRRERQLALIHYYEEPALIQVPAEVSRGETFEVAVRTFGGGCIAQGDTEVSVSGMNAEVRPYDVFVTDAPPMYVCTDELRLYPHRATLRFAEPGAAIVRIRGRERPGDRVIVVERTVTVR